MSRGFATSFYKSSAWEKARQACIRNSDGLCVKCLLNGVVRKGVIVHHKVHLTPENINDPNITLSQDNLELVCRDCHAAEHPEIYGIDDRDECRVSFDEYGNVIRKPGRRQ